MPKAVYIHIPFCNKICNYCDFCKILYDKKFTGDYLDSLEKEIKERYKGEEIKSIYIGGGTPTSLSIEELARLFKILNIFKVSDDLEFTIESNIELSEDKIDFLYSNGVNRISLGVQSFNNKILKELGRSHTRDDAVGLIKRLKNNGFNNINIDYIYGVSDDINIIKEDLETFLELDIEHISCYSLIIENNTVFKNREYISEDIEYEMYNYIKNKLEENNYIHYEISNYCKNEYYSRHNLVYWNNQEYYGFGLSAVSYIDNMRISNTKNFSKYVKGDYVNEEVLEDKKTRMENDLILGLRKVKGVSIKDFYNKYNVDVRDIFKIDDLINKKMIEIKDGYIRIKDDYLYLSNEVLVNFIGE